MDITKKRYSEMVDNVVPKSKLFSDCIGAFFIGGIICTIGQALKEMYTMIGFGEKDVSCLTSATLVFIGTALTFLGLYDNIAKKGGAGTLVPITGFANAVASPAMEFKSEGFVPGTGAKMFIIAGPVIAYGTAASVLYGILLNFRQILML